MLDERGNIRPPLIGKILQNCQCRCKGVKTKLLLQGKPSAETLSLIDNTPFGAQIIASKDKCLGLHAYAPYLEYSGDEEDTPAGHPQATPHNTARIPYFTASDEVFAPYLAKVDKRSQSFQFQGGVIHHKVLDW